MRAGAGQDVEEQVEQQHEERDGRREDDQTPRVTGHPGVDEVIASLDQLDRLPVADHVAVFEAAHAGLRDALSRAGES